MQKVLTVKSHQPTMISRQCSFDILWCTRFLLWRSHQATMKASPCSCTYHFYTLSFQIGRSVARQSTVQVFNGNYDPSSTEMLNETDEDENKTMVVGLVTKRSPYTLWEFNIAVENGHLQWVFPFKKLGFSIVMLNYQRVHPIKIPLNHQKNP